MDKFRRQLKKLPLNVSPLLDGQSWDELSSDEIYVLARALPGATHQERLRIYSRVLKEAIEAGHTQTVSSVDVLQQMRQQLSIKDEEHYQTLVAIGAEHLHPNFS